MGYHAMTGLGATTAELREQARQYYEQGQTAFDAGNYTEALRLFQLAYRTFTRPEVFVAIASTHARLGQWREARDNAQRYLYADPGGPVAARAREIITQADHALAAPTAPAPYLPKEIPDTPITPPSAAVTYAPSSNVGLWIGVGVSGAAILGLAWWLGRKRG